VMPQLIYCLQSDPVPPTSSILSFSRHPMAFVSPPLFTSLCLEPQWSQFDAMIITVWKWGMSETKQWQLSKSVLLR